MRTVRHIHAGDVILPGAGRGRAHASSAGRRGAAVLAWPGPRGIVGAPVLRRALSRAPRCSTQIGGSHGDVTWNRIGHEDLGPFWSRRASGGQAWSLWGEAEPTLNGALTSFETDIGTGGREVMRSLISGSMRARGGSSPAAAVILAFGVWQLRHADLDSLRVHADRRRGPDRGARPVGGGDGAAHHRPAGAGPAERRGLDGLHPLAVRGWRSRQVPVARSASTQVWGREAGRVSERYHEGGSTARRGMSFAA